jgi:hypothetical protein
MRTHPETTIGIAPETVSGTAQTGLLLKFAWNEKLNSIESH